MQIIVDKISKLYYIRLHVMSEQELINRCIQKDFLAWGEFVRRYSGLVYWAIEHRLKKWDYFYHHQDVEEIHQNVFLSLWKKNKLEQVKDQKKVAGWIVIVSGNEAIDYFRHEKSQVPPNAISIFEEIIQKDGAITLADILPSNKKDDSAANEPDEIGKILEAGINSLSAKEKLILKLNTLYNKKYREIAEMLDMPLGSVATSIKNIKSRLKKRLRGQI